MPIVENDSWRQHYFAGVDCPDEVTIPTDDPLAGSAIQVMLAGER
jgi:hypothetical protein